MSPPRRSATERRRLRPAVVIGTCLLSAVGCEQQMSDQPRVEVYEASPVFDDGLGSRPPVEGTIARGELVLDEVLLTGRENGELVDRFPTPITRDDLRRGRERFDVFCSSCHGRVGTGDGMVVQRGFPRPPSYHIARLREVPHGHVFDVITNGLGRMPSLKDRIPPKDRWRIVAYVRALQLSQNVPFEEFERLELSEEERQQAREALELSAGGRDESDEDGEGHDGE